MTSPYEIKKEICEIGRRIYMNLWRPTTETFPLR